MSSTHPPYESDARGETSLPNPSQPLSPGGDAVCPFRTSRFHDEGCARYYDCPSHVLERVLSVPDVEGDADRDDEDDRRERHTGRAADASPTTERNLPVERGSEPGPAAQPSPDSASPPGRPAPEDSVTQRDAESAAVSSEQPGDTSETAAAAAAAAAATTATAEGSTVALEGTPAPPPRRPSEDAHPATFADAAPLSPAPRAPEETGASNGPQARHPTPPMQSPPEQTRPPAPIVLPRWQPDAEATYCPICRTQFSIFIRKHHCRKCGRVVCNACSPHRITIPYQYIVRPPGAPRYPAPRGPGYGWDEASYGAGPDILGGIGGGEKVRLCNPCVPDPNTAPPDPRSSSGTPGTPGTPGVGHPRSYAGAGHPYGPSNSASDYEGHARSRSVTMTGGNARSYFDRPPSYAYAPASAQSRILVGTLPAYHGPGPSLASHGPYEPWSAMTPSRDRAGSSAFPGAADGGGPSSSSSASSPGRRRHAHPPPVARRQIPEEDECPVCHRELPPRTLPDCEARREAHISACIASHSTYRRGATAAAAAAAAAGGGADGSSSSPSSPPLPPPPPRRTGMFPYLATEKDCVDSAECSICLEEFEVGVPMARLECLCRFHRKCIAAWWERHPGRCPMHQHDGYGY